MVRLPSQAFRRHAVPVDSATWCGGFDLGANSPGSRSSFGVKTLTSLKGSEKISDLHLSLMVSDAYDIENEILGRGGFGTVRKAWSKENGQLHAV